MNQIIPNQSFDSVLPLSGTSPAFTHLLAAIQQGASQREHDRDLPFEAIRLVVSRGWVRYGCASKTAAAM